MIPYFTLLNFGAIPKEGIGDEFSLAHTAWIKGSKEIARLKLMTMEPKIQRNLENLHAHEMLQELKTLFAQQAEQELLQTTQDFHSCKQEEGQSVSSLRKEFDGFVQNYIMHSMGKTITEFHAMVKLHEQTLPKNNAPALYAIRADGFINRFVNNIIQVSRNIIVSFSAILRDGIYEIDLSNSYRNDSSMYAVNNKRAKLDLDSALLWHCRLRHISKKRIEKLQHDGLLNLTDLRAFEKYVEKTPYKVWHGKAPKLSYLKVWGCEALVNQDTLTKPDKLEPMSIKCIFIGYPKEIIGYSFYYPSENKVLVAQNAKFLENNLITQEASRSLEDLEIIQEEDTHPSIDTNLNHEEEDQEFDEPQSDTNPIRRSTMTHCPTDHMCLYIDAKEYELRDLGETANSKAALLDPESDKCKWLFKKRTDMDRAVHTYKAHLVAKGYTQMLGIDYEETFSPVVDIGAIRILIAIRYHMENSNRGSIPMQDKLRLSKSQGDLHLTTIKNILKYLRNTKDMFLIYEVLDWICLFILNGGVVDWKSAKQNIFATSSAEAEYIVAFDASKEAVGLENSFLGLNDTIGASPELITYLFGRSQKRLRASSKLKPGALSLYMGNGQREAIEAIGIFYLCLTSGLEIVLENCHYAPSITRGVIFVSRLYEDGFINRFENNTIQVSRNNMVYFSAIPRDGIFEIDLSNSYTNDSSIKKRIGKLQHDRLLNSTDLRDFEKYISYMSGKMARKPYTHQVERAKDLLGLIHTNVCGPYKIMSRQGASYFVTFTDEFSRYGYVYLLKHEHEVFKNFKVFQKEVENQLGKTIKLLRSDREGEYMSQEFLDHLNDHGIIAHRTSPYTPQYNGVSERRNRTLLDMV
nr:hypothetical protein [Tanacetum cinerariifolium]